MVTEIVKHVFLRRAAEIEKKSLNAEFVQTQVLSKLVRASEDTLWGHEHRFSIVKDYRTFVENVPISDYSGLDSYINMMLEGKRDILCPGLVKNFAITSGTCGKRQKTIPVSDANLRDTHLQGGFDSVACYLNSYPDSKLFDGKSLVLGGSFTNEKHFSGCNTGMISAILISNMNPLVSLFRVPGKHIATERDFDRKTDCITEKAIHQNVTSLSGIPAWILFQLNKISSMSGGKTISEIWPGLEVFFHGGTSIEPYRESFRSIIDNPQMRYLETYNASEGFFSMQDNPEDPAMLLMTDYGVFYEFIPLTEGEPVPLCGVKTDVDYEMVITTGSGLWRYRIGDVLRFTKTSPYKFIITGRTGEEINIAAEKLSSSVAQKALNKTCDTFGLVMVEFTVAPLLSEDGSSKGRHQWLIEFVEEPHDVEAFEKILDTNVSELNEAYGLIRNQIQTIGQPEVIVARKGLFNDYLRGKGRLGGQTKIPRLRNDRTLIEELLKS